MSRHRRQASQVLPPEILAGDDLTKSFDLTQQVAEGGAAKSATISTTNQQHQERETPLATTSPVTATKKPPPTKST
ncbi:hypothetical protein E2542_SST28734 [Spatholobus suberectus]|nr:hypothetical protein E2542_SST28734 [Spatholobus suberectus]